MTSMPRAGIWSGRRQRIGRLNPRTTKCPKRSKAGLNSGFHLATARKSRIMKPTSLTITFLPVAAFPVSCKSSEEKPATQHLGKVKTALIGRIMFALRAALAAL